MTDIVERAKTRLRPGACFEENDDKLIAELADEIERLQSERDQFAEQAAMRDNRDADMQEIMRINNELKTELERLQAAYDSRGAEMETMREVLATTQNWNEERVAEIKQLQGELNLERRRLATSEELRTGLVGGIERLQADNADLLTMRIKDGREMVRLLRSEDDGAEALRAAGVEISDLKAEIERLQKQCEGLAQSAMNNGQDLLLKEAEIERLQFELNNLRRAMPRNTRKCTGL
jgi:hypothetical protein